jgi:hypothetical protein
LEFVIIFAVLLAVVVTVTAPLRRTAIGAYQDAHEDEAAQDHLIDLEAAREAKYREIRDADLDHRTGKLSDEDYAAIDTALRAEAIEILHALDTAQADGGVDGGVDS